MNEDDIERDLAPSLLWVLVAGMLVALPMLIWSAYDFLNPRAATVNDRQLPAFETYEVELYKDLSNRDAAFLFDYDKQKVRAMYDSVATRHVELARAAALRGLFMYGALLFVSAGMFAFKFRIVRRL